MQPHPAADVWFKPLKAWKPRKMEGKRGKMLSSKSAGSHPRGLYPADGHFTIENGVQNGTTMTIKSDS